LFDDEELDDDLPNPVRLGRPSGSQDQYINWELPNGKLVPIRPRYELVTKYEIKKLRNFESEQRLKSFVTQQEAITTMCNSTSNSTSSTSTNTSTTSTQTSDDVNALISEGIKKVLSKELKSKQRGSRTTTEYKLLVFFIASIIHGLSLNAGSMAAARVVIVYCRM